MIYFLPLFVDSGGGGGGGDTVNLVTNDDGGFTVMGQPVQKIQAQGYNGDVDTGEEDVYSGGSARSYPAAAAATTVVSSSANDAAAGTGARTVRVIGLDANYRKISSDGILNGTNAVTLDKEFYRINSFEVLTAGSGATSAGVISVKHGATVLDQIEAGINKARTAAFTPYSNVANWVITKAFFSNLVATTPGHYRLYTRKLGGVWQVRWSSNANTSLTAPIHVEAGEDIRMTGIATADNSFLSGGFDLIGSSAPL